MCPQLRARRGVWPSRGPRITVFGGVAWCLRAGTGRRALGRKSNELGAQLRAAWAELQFGATPHAFRCRRALILMPGHARSRPHFLDRSGAPTPRVGPSRRQKSRVGCSGSRRRRATGLARCAQAPCPRRDIGTRLARHRLKASRGAPEARGDAEEKEHEGVSPRVESSPSTLDLVAAAELQERLVRKVLSLAEPYRDTLLLRFYEGLSIRQIAKRVNAPIETVRSRLYRALGQLRAEFKAEDREDWRLAFLPLAGAPGLNTGASVAAGVLLMAKTKVAVLVGLIAILGIGTWLVGQGSAQARFDGLCRGGAGDRIVERRRSSRPTGIAPIRPRPFSVIRNPRVHCRLPRPRARAGQPNSKGRSCRPTESRSRTCASSLVTRRHRNGRIWVTEVYFRANLRNIEEHLDNIERDDGTAVCHRRRARAHRRARPLLPRDNRAHGQTDDWRVGQRPRSRRVLTGVPMRVGREALRDDAFPVPRFDCIRRVARHF